MNIYIYIYFKFHQIPYSSLFGFALTSEGISGRCLFVAVLLTNVLSYWNTMQQTTTPHTVAINRHVGDLPLCYQLMLNIIMETTTIHLNVLGLT